MRPVSYGSCMHCKAHLTKEGVKRKRCAGCHSVFYDDVACQKKDWAIHKTECKELQRRFIAMVRSEYPEVDTMAKLLARPDVCRIIAEHYYRGEGGFEENCGLAIFWAMQWMKSDDGKAMKGDNAEAMAVLGRSYTSGVVPHKRKEGVKLLLRACAPHRALEKEKLLLAQCQLGRCYRLGNGVQANDQEAMKWYRLAAEGGDADAQSELGTMLAFCTGVEKDKEEAIVWYRKAAEQGNAPAQLKFGLHLLGTLPKTGADATKESIAVKWIRRSAEQGMARAEFVLGECLMIGDLVARDPTEAVVWFRKSADQGNAGAQLKLGCCYHNGEGVAVDRDEAIRWLRLSADQGNDQAKEALLMWANSNVPGADK